MPYRLLLARSVAPHEYEAPVESLYVQLVRLPTTSWLNVSSRTFCHSYEPLHSSVVE